MTQTRATIVYCKKKSSFGKAFLFKKRFEVN